MNKPIILNNAVNRVGDDNKIFEYDYNKDINVIQMNGQEIPFISIDKRVSELFTKTAEASRESDDDECSCIELYSKTNVAREQDDDEYSCCELYSKTEVTRESDDDDNSYCLELQAKIFVERE